MHYFKLLLTISYICEIAMDAKKYIKKCIPLDLVINSVLIRVNF